MTQATRIMSTSTALRVVLVDDHALVRQGLRSLLESSGLVRVVGEAGDAQQALRVLRDEQPQVVVLDLRLGEQDGMEVARECRAAAPGCRILVVSAHGSATELRMALAAGADGYLMKGITAAQLVDGIHKVAAGETVIDPAFVPALLDRMAAGDSAAPSPTLREMEVLALIADGLTAHEAAERLELSARTVQKHLENLYRKIGVSNRAELIQQAFRRGLLR